jgi:hypothetical protein
MARMMRLLPRSSRIHRASALLIVLWVVALLSFLIVTTLLIAMQEMGVALASHPMVKNTEPLLRNRLSSTESYEALITSEEARLNLNALLTEERRPVLERVFVSWGLREVDAETLVDRMVDWTDPDDLKQLKGAEKLDYRDAGFPGRPFNRPFRTLDEAALVSGAEVFDEMKPDWRDWFTLRGTGQLDVNEASAEMISLVTGVPVHLSQTLVVRRAGPDGIPHTKDDTPLQSVDEAMTLLGIPAAEAPALSALLTLKGTTVRIVSIGRAGDYARGIAVVLRKEGGAPQVLEWREFVVE